MEELWNKFGAIVAALITSIGGYYMYDRKTTHELISKVEKDANDRISKIELESSQHKIDIRVIEVKFLELKGDTEEIKSNQKEIISLLTKRKR